jgi:ABC-type multidrug transport system fused ATPase/permease subunit
MTLGELFSFTTAVALLRGHLHTVAVAVPQIIEGTESLATVHDFLRESDARPYQGTRRLAFAGRITLDSVTFGYREDPLLQDVDLTIEPGEMVALTGPNGAGKSTIVYLILGFYRPQQGQLCADGHPYADLDITHLRRHIGVVSQNPIIFPGTIWENITYGSSDPPLQEVRRAVELSTACDFIEQFPEGYETLVGERGLLLSGGQRQRIAIARALLRRPRVLILDEPTSHLDEFAMSRLVANLKELEEVPAKLIVSHDVSFTSMAERVYALEDGHITLRGRG